MLPTQLIIDQRNTRMALPLSHLQRYHEKGYCFLSQIALVTKQDFTVLTGKQASEQATETCHFATSKEMKGHTLQFW
ncbi:hypothetical protein TNCT_498251 [Trichonephila clavata]|uniref:Uncharacterized protein n=1 Tax=Trichonephila clavata TaxID=2740835 RepID=A0A8X6KFK5_TRICU|nr:hypothetical protein TNCT_498251 [Trichonephila clavata]